MAMLVPLSGDSYLIGIATSVATYLILGLGLNIVVGLAGLLDLGYAAFFAIGAYTSAILIADFHMSFWMTLLPAVAASAVAGAVLGYPTLRLRSDYLAVVTLGFGEIVRTLFNNTDSVGGPDGIWNIPPPELFGYVLNTETDFFLLILIPAIGVWMLCRNLTTSQIGLGWRALRDDEQAAEAVGIPTLRTKLTAYVLGGMAGGLAGACYASRMGMINPTSFTYAVSFLVIDLIIIGGVGSLPGVLLGAMLVIGLPEALRVVDRYRLLGFAIAIIVLMLVRPQGLWPYRGRNRVSSKAASTEALPTRVVAVAPPFRRELHGKEPILLVEGLQQRYGGLIAAADISFEVRAGEIFSLIGPNGAGKTTVFNCITGVSAPKAGRIQFQGTVINGYKPHQVVASGLARTFQGIRLFRQLTVIENIMAGGYSRRQVPLWSCALHAPLQRAAEEAATRDAVFWMQFFGIGHLAERLASELSYADQRRVEMARALAAHPALLLLDEPAAGMNGTEKVALGELIRKIRDLGVSVVLIEHDMALVMTISDRVMVMEQGRILTIGLPNEVRNDPRVIDAYIGRDEVSREGQDLAAI